MKNIFFILLVSFISCNSFSTYKVNNIIEEDLNRIEFCVKRYIVFIDIQEKKTKKVYSMLNDISYYNNRNDLIKIERPIESPNENIISYEIYRFEYSYDESENIISAIFYNNLNIATYIYRYYLDINMRKMKTECFNMENRLLFTNIYQYNEYGNIIATTSISNNEDWPNEEIYYFYNNRNELEKIESISETKAKIIFSKTIILKLDRKGRIIKNINYFYDDGFDSEPSAYFMEHKNIRRMRR